MIARLLKNWGPYKAGQMLSGRAPGSIPDSDVEWYEEDDPQLLTIGHHNLVQNDEVPPLKGLTSPEPTKPKGKK